MKKIIMAGIGLLALVSCVLADTSSPNIIIIMVDDMGFSDPRCFGGEVDTPNIDLLAKKGLRFRQFYNASRCCPTRASLMTGCYPHQVGLAKNGQSLTRDGVTIAEVLKGAGYQTGMAGKWHLTKTEGGGDQHMAWLNRQINLDQPFGPVDSYPVNRGFDKSYGIIWGVINFFDPFSLVEGTEVVKEVPDNYYITTAITEKAVDYVHDFSKKKAPFFMYVAHCAPHWPLHALPEDIAKYKGRYNMGWDELRKQRYERQIKMGLFSNAHGAPGAVDGGTCWADLSPDEKAWQARKMEIHAAMVDRVDQGIGQILDALKKTGQYENTVIMFMSDNGASPEIPGDPGYDRNGETRDGQEVLRGKVLKSDPKGMELAGSELSYLGVGPSWANAANTPFRYWKKESYEGGCHTPMIVHWPAGLLAKRGSINDQIGHVIDVMPTCVELAGATYPTEYAGHTIIPAEGESFVRVLRGDTKTDSRTLGFEHVGGKAFRQGDWKISQKGGKWELFKITADISETRDLSAKHPEKMKELLNLWNAWADRVGAAKGSKQQKRKKEK